MSYKRILTVQDISCVGQCSLTVALPVLSAEGVETCVLPSAILSTHTAGFTGYTVSDFTDEIPAVIAHWKKEKINFDGVYTGYLGSVEQIESVKEIISDLLVPGGITIIDPAMADGGKLYPAFNSDYADAMKTLVKIADYTLPNITEACFLTGMPYRETYDKAYVIELSKKLCDAGAKTVVLTGVSYREGKTGVAIYSDGEYSYYEHKKIEKSYHGTGDIYSSAFAGALMRGKPAFEAAAIAADYTVLCIEKTVDDPEHWYGVKFETAIPELIQMLAK